MADLSFNGKLEPIRDGRITPGNHTAFGFSAYVNRNIIIAQSEGTGHALIAGTKPVIYLSTDNGISYTKSYLSLTGISGAASNDIRNLAGGSDHTGKIWVFGTDYVNAAEAGARLWYWTSTDSGLTWSNPTQITYNTVTYDWITFYGQLVDLGSGVLIVPAYGQKGSNAESYAMMLKSSDNGVSWAVSNIYTGNTTTASDYVTECDIISTSGNNLICMIRREQSKPRLMSSSNGGTSWTSEGVITVAPSDQCHAPWFYKDGDRVCCLFSDRTNNNVFRLYTDANYTDDATWNASNIEVVVGSVIQNGFGGYNFGYTSTIGQGSFRKLVWYDIALSSTNPAVINTNAYTEILITPLHEPPKLMITANTGQTYTAGAEEDVTFDTTLINVDNKGGFNRATNEYTVQEDGFYNISFPFRTSSVSFASYTQLTMYYEYNASFTNKFVTQAGAIGQGFQFITLNTKCYLRKGQKIWFMLYNNNGSNLTVNGETPPILSIFKEI